MISWLKLILIKFFDRVALYFYFRTPLLKYHLQVSQVHELLLNIFPLRV
jgi:hypothetical protein